MNLGNLDKMIDENTPEESKNIFSGMSKREFMQWRCDNMNRKCADGGQYVVVEKEENLYIEWRKKV